MLQLTGAAGALALAGCVSDEENGGTDSEESAANETGTGEDDATEDEAGEDEPSENDADGEDGRTDETAGEHEYDHPGETVEAFLVAWQEGDVEAANALIYDDGELEPVDEPPEELVADAPEIETIERPEIEAETATVETLLVPPEVDEPQAVLFELVQVDGAWLLVDLVPQAEEVAPSVQFEISTDDGEAEIVHVAGDSVAADELFVRGDGLGETGSWADLDDERAADDDVLAGDSLTITVEDQYTVELVWEDDEHSRVLHTESGARESDDESDPVDSFLADTDNYDGTVEEFLGEEEVVVETGATHDGDEPLFFDPPAIRVDEGATVIWEWVSDGSGHNVAEVDGAFESEIKDGEGETFSYTFEESGTYRYVCQPHRELGMKGAVVVE